jgi:hypothetical protein
MIRSAEDILTNEKVFREGSAVRIERIIGVWSSLVCYPNQFSMYYTHYPLLPIITAEHDSN